MATTYTTVSGDTFDQIALRLLGSEYLYPLLLQANPAHRTTLRFSAGITLVIPDVSNETTFENEPDWLAGDGEQAMQEEDTGGVYG